jgi:hypothetical protein
MSRLAKGGLIERARPLAFTFDGRRMAGFAGDTLASALVANDVKLIGRSFGPSPTHRPPPWFSMMASRRRARTAGPASPLT